MVKEITRKKINLFVGEGQEGAHCQNIRRQKHKKIKNIADRRSWMTEETKFPNFQLPNPTIMSKDMTRAYIQVIL